MKSLLLEKMEELGDLDAIAGDGDHGVGMERGSRTAAEAAEWLATEGAGAQSTLVGAGSRWSENAGGASGALWGAALAAAGNALGDNDPIDTAAQSRAIRAFSDSIQRLGGAQVGDKTMVCAQVPFADAFEAAAADGKSASEAWAIAAAAAIAAATATAQLEPKIGRARVLAQRSLGYADPGAVSFGMIVSTMAALFEPTPSN